MNNFVIRRPFWLVSEFLCRCNSLLNDFSFDRSAICRAGIASGVLVAKLFTIFIAGALWCSITYRMFSLIEIL